MAEEKEKKAGVVLHKKSAAPKAAEPKSADGAQAAAAPVEKKKMNRMKLSPP